MLFLASSSQLNAPNNDQVPNQIAPFRRLKAVGTTQDWFNTSAFVQPAGAAFGNMGQNVYSGPGLVAFDASLQKDFPIHENIGLTMRLQGFNALNHPIFANPNTTLTSTSFGQVTSTLGSGGTSIGSRAMQVAATLHF
jgi:hypothetical protein